MIKKIFIFIIIIFPLNILALEYPDLYSSHAIIYNKTNDTILYDLNANEKVSIASLTKIVTTITALEIIDNVNEEVVITSTILNTVDPIASKAGLKVGDKLTYLDLLYASMLPSGADATNALAILSSDSIDNFVSKMNDLAKKLDLKNTHFVNVTGLDEDNHYSSAYDIMKILSYALENPTFKVIYTTKKYSLSNGLTIYSTLNKYNSSLKLDIENIIGSKTGFTLDAGYCLSSLTNIENQEIIVIVLNAPYDESYHLIDTVNLINFIQDNYSMQTLIKKDEIIKVIPIKYSKNDNYNIVSAYDINLFLPNDYDKNLWQVSYSGLEKLSFINKKDEIIGKVTYSFNGKEISSYDVILKTNISINIFKILKDYWYICLAIVVILVYTISHKKGS